MAFAEARLKRQVSKFLPIKAYARKQIEGIRFLFHPTSLAGVVDI